MWVGFFLGGGIHNIPYHPLVRYMIHLPGTQMTLVLIGISALFWGVDLQK